MCVCVCFLILLDGLLVVVLGRSGVWVVLVGVGQPVEEDQSHLDAKLSHKQPTEVIAELYLTGVLVIRSSLNERRRKVVCGRSQRSNSQVDVHSKKNCVGWRFVWFVSESLCW